MLNSNLIIIIISTCEEFHCLHACEADYIMDSELDSPDIESYKHGNIEVACHVSKRFISRTPCEAKISNEMAIGFLNSGIKFEKSIHDESSSEENDPALKAFGKACLNHFNTRMAVGTHVARWADLDEWSSKAARPFYVNLEKIVFFVKKKKVVCYVIFPYF